VAAQLKPPLAWFFARIPARGPRRNELTNNVDRPQLSPVDIKKLETAMQAKAAAV